MRNFAESKKYMMKANRFICFDTESAQGRCKTGFIEELIEISIMNGNGENIFYHRFKPARLSRWDTKIHHITPAMVADEPPFSTLRNGVQDIFDHAEYIIGFSLIDDFKAVGKAGITGCEKHRQVELRHLYWYCIGRHNGVPFYSGPGLSHCAEELGVEIVSDAVHTADGDTRVTLNLFFALIKMFAAGEGFGDELPDTDSREFRQLVDLALRRIREAKYEYDREVARGFINVIRNEDGCYRFVPSLNGPDESVDDAVLSIQVNARRRAAYELEKKFSRRRILNTKNFRLTASDLEAVKCYSNEFDNQEQMYQRLLGMQRNMAGVKL